ncbi:hypothetical protein CYY_002065 [Polysphondylium violaceum]|uniref:DUF155 domain-containing protein n=1 Tax=Polysphondylium violaceum TaxID=133409 RepID=A0A8J4UVJ4_9MYCE|nr:hypothetical protein CYY_002065 [Polysphondylium violaceum]
MQQLINLIKVSPFLDKKYKKNIQTNGNNNDIDLDQFTNLEDMEKIKLPPYKINDFQVKRNKYPGHQPCLINGLYSSTDHSPLSQSGVQNLPKKVTSFCISDSINMEQSYSVIDGLNFKPKAYKYFYYFVIPRESNPNNLSNPSSPNHSTQNLNPSHQHEFEKIPTQNSINSLHQLQHDSNSTSSLDELIDNSNSNLQLVVVYEYGVVVCWNLTPTLQIKILSLMEPHIISPLSPRLVDEMIIEKNNTTNRSTVIINDHILFPTGSDNLNSRLVLSNMISQSLKISLFEETLFRMIQLTHHVPSQLVHKGKVDMPGFQVGHVIGNLFKLKNSLSIIIQVFKAINRWSTEYDEPTKNNIQTMSRKYLDIKYRLKSIDQKMKYVDDIVSVCKSEHETRGSNRLEMIVIILIFFELLFMVLQFIYSIKG